MKIKVKKDKVSNNYNVTIRGLTQTQLIDLENLIEIGTLSCNSAEFIQLPPYLNSKGDIDEVFNKLIAAGIKCAKRGIAK